MISLNISFIKKKCLVAVVKLKNILSRDVSSCIFPEQPLNSCLHVSLKFLITLNISNNNTVTKNNPNN